MAVCNGEAFLPEQMDSILCQSDERWHLTVSDDGSVDDSAAIIDEYVLRYPNRIARYRSGRRFGNARDHFFHLMARCDADYMLFCDQDDVWYPDKVLKTRRALEDAETAWGRDMPVLVFSDQTPTDAELKPLAPSLMRYQDQYFEPFRLPKPADAERGHRRRDGYQSGAGPAGGALRGYGWRDHARLVARRRGGPIREDRLHRRAVGLLSPAWRECRRREGRRTARPTSWIALRGMGEVRRSILRKKAQARAFEACYRDELEPEDDGSCSI